MLLLRDPWVSYALARSSVDERIRGIPATDIALADAEAQTAESIVVVRRGEARDVVHLVAVQVVVGQMQRLADRLSDGGEDVRIDNRFERHVQGFGSLRIMTFHVGQRHTRIHLDLQETGQFRSTRNVDRETQEVDRPRVDSLLVGLGHDAVEGAVALDERTSVRATDLGLRERGHGRQESGAAVGDEVVDRTDLGAAFLDVDREKRLHRGQVLSEELITLRDVLGEPGLTVLVGDQAADVRGILGEAGELCHPALLFDESFDRQTDAGREDRGRLEVGHDVGDHSHRKILDATENRLHAVHADIGSQDEGRVSGDGEDRSLLDFGTAIAELIRFLAGRVEDQTDVIASGDVVRIPRGDELTDSVDIGGRDEVATESIDRDVRQIGIDLRIDFVADVGRHLVGAGIHAGTDDDALIDRDARVDQFHALIDVLAHGGDGEITGVLIGTGEDERDADPIVRDHAGLIVRSVDAFEVRIEAGFDQQFLHGVEILLAFGIQVGRSGQTAQQIEDVLRAARLRRGLGGRVGVASCFAGVATMHGNGGFVCHDLPP